MAVVGTFRTHNDGKGFRKIKDGVSPCIPARAREDGSGQPIISYVKPAQIGQSKKTYAYKNHRS